MNNIRTRISPERFRTSSLSEFRRTSLPSIIPAGIPGIIEAIFEIDPLGTDISCGRLHVSWGLTCS